MVAEPADALVKSGKQPTDFDAFLGASSGEDLSTMASKANVGGYSFQNRKRYYSTYTAEPYIIIGYPELMFNIAEGINRGWALVVLKRITRMVSRHRGRSMAC